MQCNEPNKPINSMQKLKLYFGCIGGSVLSEGGDCKFVTNLKSFK